MNLSELAFFVDNVNETADFYERLLGTAPVYRDEGIAIFRMGDLTLLIHRTYQPGEGDLPCKNHFAFSVENLESAVADLATKGIPVEISPRDYPWGRSAYLSDPNRQLIELIQRTEST